MSEQAGRVNQYVCEECGHKTTTINDCDGTTPFLIKCRSLGECQGMAQSEFYRVDQNLVPTHVWYRPEIKELAALDAPTQEHVDNGGLLLKRLDGAQREKYGYRLRHG